VDAVTHEPFCMSCESEGYRRLATTTRGDLALCRPCAVDWDVFHEEEQYEDWDGTY
jgi:hypothetical protein